MKKKMSFTKKVVIIATAFILSILALILILLVAISSVFNGVNLNVKFGIPKSLQTLWESAAKTCPELNWQMLAAEENVASNWQPDIQNNTTLGVGIAGLPQTLYAEFVKPIPKGGQKNGDIFDIIDSTYALARIDCSVLRNIPTITDTNLKIELTTIPLIQLESNTWKPIISSSHTLKAEKKFIKKMESVPWSNLGQYFIGEVQAEYKKLKNG